MSARSLVSEDMVIATSACALSPLMVPSPNYRAYHLARDQYRSMKLSSGWNLGREMQKWPRDSTSSWIAFCCSLKSACSESKNSRQHGT